MDKHEADQGCGIMLLTVALSMFWLIAGLSAGWLIWGK